MCNVYISHYDKSIFFLFVYLNTISKIWKKQEKQMKKSLYTHGRQFKPRLFFFLGPFTLFVSGSSQNIKKENKKNPCNLPLGRCFDVWCA